MAGLIGVGAIICQASFADLTVEKEIIQTSPLSGEEVSRETVLVNEDDFAVGKIASRGAETRTVVRDQGDELLLINYKEQTYSVFDDYLIDSLLEQRGKVSPEQDDSLRSLMQLNRLDLEYTGNTKDIFGLEAREVDIRVDVEAKAPLFDELVMPLRIVIRGSEWITSEFDAADMYLNSNRFLMSLPSSVTRDIFGDFSRLLRRLDASDSLVDHVSKIVSQLKLEGSIHVTIELGATGDVDLKGEPVPGMTWTMKFETTCLNISFESIPEEEFGIPRGYRKVHNAFNEIGAFLVPGLEKWFALDKDV